MSLPPVAPASKLQNLRLSAYIQSVQYQDSLCVLMERDCQQTKSHAVAVTAGSERGLSLAPVAPGRLCTCSMHATARNQDSLYNLAK